MQLIHGSTRQADDPSLATEAGENRLNYGTDPTASLCSPELGRGRAEGYSLGYNRNLVARLHLNNVKAR